MISIFTLLFHYVFFPAAALFSVVAGITLSCYSFKATVFLLSGSFSIHKYDMPQALVVSKLELLVGVVFSAASGGLFALYETFRTKQLERREPRLMMPYDPQDMSERVDTLDLEEAVNMTENIFELELADSNNSNEY